ncbi:hypothetical protein QE152_g28307 [Popillia japonica]|uniref:Transposase n=1 Tax=Popillia japonica TaxID=7064 RepID=A0AAW1JMV5_POPJA
MPQLTNVERAVIISKLEDNWSLRRIAAHMHVSKSCVFKIKTIWQTEQRTEKRARPNGLRKISNEEEDQALIQYVLENLFTTSVNACAETHFSGCSKTARRRLKEAGIHNLANEFINRDEDFWTHKREESYKGNKRERPEYGSSPEDENRIFQKSKVLTRTPPEKVETDKQINRGEMEDMRQKKRWRA